MQAGSHEEEARRAKEAYCQLFFDTRGAPLAPGDISFLTNRAAAYLRIGKYLECVKDCDEAVERGRELNADHKLIAKALWRKALALLQLACCARDYAPVIMALRQSLAEHHTEETAATLDGVQGTWRVLEEQERLAQEDADHQRERGNDLFRQKKYTEAAMHYTQALKLSPKDPRINAMEEYLSRAIEELEQLKVQHNEVNEKLCDTKEHNENLQVQYEWLLSEHDNLLRERDRAVREVNELRQKRGQMLSVLVTSMHCEFSSSEIERATENFSNSRKIGEGAFGCVYTGILRNMTVAIKVLKSDSLQGQSHFEQEVAILSRVRHPHLVTLLGACSESSTLVYEFLPNGSLEDFLGCADKRATLSWEMRIRIIAEICSALIFLHKNKPHPVVHGDLKPGNILLDANLISKLSDFGISRLLIHSSSNNTTLYRTMHPMGSHFYMDPEFLSTGEMRPHSDVYSFGIVVLRLLTGKDPRGIKNIVEDALAKGDLNSIVDASAGEWPDVLAQQLAHLALSCTELSQRRRPDLSGDVWRMVEAMRDAATSSSASSSRSVPREISMPSYFICPISQEAMNDPHVAADGFTYEAECIKAWLDRGHGTSPMTNEPLEHDMLIPNRALRSAIQEWQQQQNMAP